MYEFEKKQQNGGLLKRICRKMPFEIRILVLTSFYEPVSEFWTFWD